MQVSVFARVFGNGWYATLTLALFLLGVSVVLLLPNYALISKVLFSDAVSLSAKLHLITSLYGSIAANFTVFSAFYTLLVLALFSINVSLLVFYIRRSQKKTKGMKSSQARSVVGIISGVLGIGCAACGSVILTSLAASFGATGLLLALPLHGGEFALIGIGLLTWSIWYLVRKIDDPLVCTID